ncbi:MAG: hypothetical protein K1W16_08605 [Lachnospiraceae bacterium]
MIWKIAVRLLGCRNRNYIKAISLKNEIYIIEIHKFVPVSKEIRQWENAFEASKASN